mgnify:CR=1 FL=1
MGEILKNRPQELTKAELEIMQIIWKKEKVLVHLNKGTNQIILRAYNRFEKETSLLLRPSAEQVIYKQNVVLDAPADRVKVRRTGLATQHTDTELHNLIVK